MGRYSRKKPAPKVAIGDRVRTLQTIETMGGLWPIGSTLTVTAVHDDGSFDASAGADHGGIKRLQIREVYILRAKEAA